MPPPNPAAASSRIQCWGKQLLRKSEARLSLLTDTDSDTAATSKPKPKRMPKIMPRPTQPDYPPPVALQAAAGHDAGGLQCEGDRGGGGRGDGRGGGGNSVVMTPVKIEPLKIELCEDQARRDAEWAEAELNKKGIKADGGA